MADLAASRPTDVTSDRTGLLPRAGDMLTQFRAVSEQPAFRRALPTIVAVIVTLIGMAAYFLMQQPSRTTLYASLPETEKSRVLDALKNAGVDVVLDPTTGDVMVPASDYHSSRIMLAAQGLPTVVPTGYENLDSIQMGSSRSVESMRLKQAQELELARSLRKLNMCCPLVFIWLCRNVKCLSARIPAHSLCICTAGQRPHSGPLTS